MHNLFPLFLTINFCFVTSALAFRTCSYCDSLDLHMYDYTDNHHCSFITGTWQVRSGHFCNKYRDLLQDCDQHSARSWCILFGICTCIPSLEPFGTLSRMKKVFYVSILYGSHHENVLPRAVCTHRMSPGDDSLHALPVIYFFCLSFFVFLFVSVLWASLKLFQGKMSSYFQ